MKMRTQDLSGHQLLQAFLLALPDAKSAAKAQLAAMQPKELLDFVKARADLLSVVKEGPPTQLRENIAKRFAVLLDSRDLKVTVTADLWPLWEELQQWNALSLSQVPGTRLWRIDKHFCAAGTTRREAVMHWLVHCHFGSFVDLSRPDGRAAEPPSIEALKRIHGYEHPAFHRSAWREDVAREDTIEGYWAWAHEKVSTYTGSPEELVDDPLEP